MKKKILAFAAAFVLAMFSFAQSSVQIKDILVSPVMEVDTITNLPVESDSEKFSVMCKINNITDSQTVQILV